MKKLLMIAFAFTLTAGVIAQTKMGGMKKSHRKGAMHHNMMKDCCMMKDGEMMMMKNGKCVKMEHDMTMKNGTICKADGSCTMKDGKTMTMKDGECMYMDGKMGKMGKIKMGKGLGKMKM